MPPSTWPRRALLPMLISLLLHGLLVLGLFLVPAKRNPLETVVVDTVVLESDTPLTLSLAPPPLHPAPRPPAPLDEPFAPRVDELPLNPSPSSPPAVVQVSGPASTPAGSPWSSHPEAGSAGKGTAAPGVFQAAGRARTVVYLVDRSVSMGLHHALARARCELLASLERLPATTRFQVIPYNRQAEPLLSAGRGDLLPADPATVARLGALIAGLPAAGGTDHVKALRRGLAFRPDVLFLLTDADDMTLAEVQLVTRFNQGRTAIHTLELSRRPNPSPDNPLRRLAGLNRGTYQALAPD